MPAAHPTQPASSPAEPAGVAWTESQVDPLAEAARRDFQFLWRTLRRLGVEPDAAVDDAVQQVFEIAARKRARIEPGRERAFLFKTAVLVAADTRRAQRSSRARTGTAAREPADISADPEQRATATQHRALLDRVLSAMALETRTVFVLFELEEMSCAEIAALLSLPPGTVSSRLRRGREQFQVEARRLRARADFRGGV